MTKEEEFYSIINGANIKYDKSLQSSLSWVKNGKMLFKISFFKLGITAKQAVVNIRFKKEKLDCKNSNLFFSHGIWLIFRDKHNMSNEEIISFISGMAERCFKLKCTEPVHYFSGA